MSADNHDEQLINRYRELAERSERAGIYLYSDFHSPAGAALAYRVAGESSVKLWGGADGCERVLVRFGDPDEIGYDEEFPVILIHIVPKQPKYADRLSHRDFLGALINLGIERDVIGDIYVSENSAYVFVCDRIVDFIGSELKQVKHTSVRCELIDEVPEAAAPQLVSGIVTVSSLRLDGIISHVYHLSRTEAKSRFSSEEVFVGGRVCIRPEYEPHEGDIISVRGCGKLVYDGVTRMTSKDRFAVKVSRYV